MIVIDYGYEAWKIELSIDKHVKQLCHNYFIKSYLLRSFTDNYILLNRRDYVLIKLFFEFFPRTTYIKRAI